MLSFAPLALAPELKFLVVAVAAVPACYLAGYALTRLPGISVPRIRSARPMVIAERSRAG